MNANKKNLCATAASLQHLIFGSVPVLLHMPREQRSHLICVSMENSGQFIKPWWPGSPIKWSTYERERERREREEMGCVHDWLY